MKGPKTDTRVHVEVLKHTELQRHTGQFVESGKGLIGRVNSEVKHCEGSKVLIQCRIMMLKQTLSFIGFNRFAKLNINHR